MTLAVGSYEDFVNAHVQRFNGVKVHNLPHLASLVQACTSEFLRYDRARLPIC